MFDTLIHNGIVVTVDRDFSVLDRGAVAIQNGRIEQVWQPPQDQPLPEARETEDACGNLIMPGLVNAHTHLPMSLFRGLADDLPLMTWLTEHIFPAEARFITPQTVRACTRLSCAEMLLNGISTCCDGYFFADQVAEAVQGAGMRAVLGQGVVDFPAPGGSDPARNIANAREFVEAWKGRSALLAPSIFCHSPYTCSADTLRAAKSAADELGVLFQIHVAETREEVSCSRSAHGCSPIEYLNQLGLLDARTLLVHSVWADSADIDTIARSGARVAHCPQSNMKLASGIAPIPAMLAAGIPVGLGTDGCASNNDLDMFSEMDMAAKLHKVKLADPTVMNAETVLRMATSKGAACLGLDASIGSLEPGKQADIVIVDLDQAHLTPMYHPVSHLVYAAGGGDVLHVMIAGRWVVRKRRLLTIEVAPLLAEVNELARAVKEQVGPVAQES
jgi:5-methylthioadenosine/S-adenosylhomocysteine deaminase